MRALRILLAIFALCPVALATGSDASIVRVRSEATYKAWQLSQWTELTGTWPFRDNVTRSQLKRVIFPPQQGIGTGWVLSTPSQKVMITAAHVLQLNSVPTVINGMLIDGKSARINGRKLKCLVGSLAFTPLEVATLEITSPTEPPRPLDIAVLRFAEEQAMAGLMEYKSSERMPKRGETVTAIGLPSTFYPQPTVAVVTHIEQTAGYFILDKELQPGYSGGVVIDSAGRAIGLVTGNTNKQTTVLMVNNALINSAKFHPFSKLTEWHAFHSPEDKK